MKNIYFSLLTPHCALAIALNIPSVLAFNPIKQFEESFATAVLITDSDTISLGIANFNPEVLLKPTQSHLLAHLTEGKSVELRNQLTSYSIPYTYLLDKDKKQLSDTLTIHISYLEQNSSHTLFENTEIIPDDNIDTVLSGYIGYSIFHPLSEHWMLRLRLGSYLMHYKNEHTFNNSVSQLGQEQFDGIYFNTQANALIVEQNARFTYITEKTWGKWEFYTDLNYFTGKAISGSKSSKGAKPTGWRINNTVKLNYSMNKSTSHAESLYIKFQRSDIGGDTVNALDTHYFYEAGIGVLLDTRKLTSWIDNIGIGININYGSALNGGSIVFYFNEF